MLLFTFPLPLFALDEQATGERCVRTLAESVPCRSAPHPETRRIFACPTRGRVLSDAGVPREVLKNLFSPRREEHQMVKIALETTIYYPRLKTLERAVLWEELTANIQEIIGHPVSQSFRAIYEGEHAYVFQGMKKFEGKVFILVLLENGGVYTGKSEPIENIGEWTNRLNELKKVR